MNDPNLSCREERRREDVRSASLFGLDYVEVVDEQQLTLNVFFLGKAPQQIQQSNVVLTGGRRIRDVQIKSVTVKRQPDPTLDDYLEIRVNKAGDFSNYTISLVNVVNGQPTTDPMPGFDPRYYQVCFSFKASCPTDLDCKAPCTCPPPQHTQPDIDYLAKDYESFRELILDRIALIMPEWTETHVPDEGITLVELLAYAGDYLSYYQDAVATEAYLGTARQRISVRRHARLVDYRMHEGNNARAWVCVSTDTDLDPLAADDLYFITGFPGVRASSGRVVRATDLEAVPQDQYEVFEPIVTAESQTLEFLAAHSRIRLYTWGDEECCLDAGATRATLLDEEPPAPGGPGARTAGPGEDLTHPATPRPKGMLRLKTGDVLVLEEVKGPTTGSAADADPAHRHAVRLTGVRQGMDRLLGKPVVEVEWAQADALPFALCLSSRLPAPDCGLVEDVSVARGNVVLVEHGRTVTERCGPVGAVSSVAACACAGSVLDEITLPAVFRPALAQGPVSYAQPVTAAAPAATALSQDPRLARPEISLTEYAGTDTDTPTGPAWRPVPDLLQSSREDRVFVAEIDDNAVAHPRFGDDNLGRQPAAGTRFQARYRVGNGTAGNVGPGTISYLVKREGTLSAGTIGPCNPLPAVG